MLGWCDWFYYCEGAFWGTLLFNYCWICAPPIWSPANCHPPAVPFHITATIWGRWKSIRDSFETCEASRLHLFKVLLILCHRKEWNTQGKGLSALFCIHELTDAHDWHVAVIHRGVIHREYGHQPREQGQFCSLCSLPWHYWYLN